VIADDGPDGPEYRAPSVFDVGQFVPAQLEAPGAGFNRLGGCEEPEAVLGVDHVCAFGSGCVKPGRPREGEPAPGRSVRRQATARNRTATYCRPGSSMRKRPSKVSGRVSMVMFQESMTSIWNRMPGGITNRR
jgi:hypothetical protein